MACSIELLTEKMQDIKITGDIFLGNDLTYEKKFLSQLKILAKKLKIVKFLFIYIKEV